MEKIDVKINIIENIVINHNNISKTNLGLFHGNMGMAIFVFNLWEKTKNLSHQNFAEKLIENIYENISSKTPCDLEFGLLGIGYGFNYLVENNFVEVNLNVILQELDDNLFQFASFENNRVLDISKLIEIGLYFIDRIAANPAEHENSRLFKDMVIHIINKISDEVLTNLEFFKDTTIFNLRWQLPSLIILLSKTLEFNFYNYKVNKFIDELLPNIISLFPFLDANKIHLLYAVQEIIKQSPNVHLIKYSEILKNNISIPNIIQKEFKDKSIDIQHGVVGFYFILKRMKWEKNKQNDLITREMILSKILKSTLWDIPIDQKIVNKQIGLANGLSGIGLGLLMLTDEQTIKL